MSRQPEVAKRLSEDGWIFVYETDTKFVGAYHPCGGKKTIVEIVARVGTKAEVDEIGMKIAAMLNGLPP